MNNSTDILHLAQSVSWELLASVGSQLDIIASIGLLATLIMFVMQQRRANRIEKQENYLRLEMASIDLFKYEGDNAEWLMAFDELERPDDLETTPALEKKASAFYFQTLNLFEISIRMRHDATIAPDVFGSWVVWYYDVLTGWFFRECWQDFRENYTVELRAIFDEFVRDFDPAEEDETRKRRFFNHVGGVLKCKVVHKWLDD